MSTECTPSVLFEAWYALRAWGVRPNVTPCVWLSYIGDCTIIWFAMDRRPETAMSPTFSAIWVASVMKMQFLSIWATLFRCFRCLKLLSSHGIMRKKSKVFPRDPSPKDSGVAMRCVEGVTTVGTARTRYIPFLHAPESMIYMPRTLRKSRHFHHGNTQ